MIIEKRQHETYSEVDKEKRYSQIKETLKWLGEATAKEIAVGMCEKGYIPTSERNFSAPRLTELCKDGIVQVVQKRRCQYTGKVVAVYELV